MDLGKRIMILGSAGSGKSTLAKRLGEVLNIAVVHIDCIYWLPNWVSRPDDETDEIIIKEAEKESWIMDGNYSRTMDFRMQKADTIVFIDFSRIFCIYRIVKRRIKYRGKCRDDIAQGCKEKIDKEFLSWVWNYPNRNRKAVIKKMEALKSDNTKNIIHLKTRKQVKELLKALS